MKKTRAARAAMVRMNVVLRESLLRACVDSTTPTESPVRSTASGAAAHQWGQSAAVTASAFSGLLVNVFTDPFIGYFRNLYIFGQPAEFVSVVTKIASGVTLVNSLLSTVCAVVLYIALRPALEKAHLLPKE